MDLTKPHLILLLGIFSIAGYTSAQQLPATERAIEAVFEEALDDYENSLEIEALEKLERAKLSATKYDFPWLSYRASFRQYTYGQSMADSILSLDSLFYYLQSFEYSNDHLYMGMVQAEIADLYGNLADIQSQIKFLFASIDSYSEVKNTVGVANNYKELSLLHYDQDDLGNARKSIYKAIKLYREAGTQKDLVGGLNNLSIIFEKSGPIDSAIFYQKMALKIAKKEMLYSSIGLVMSNLGHNYSEIGEDSLAEVTLLQALHLRDSINDRNGVAYTNIRLCYFYSKINQPDKAIKYGNQGLKIAESISYVKAQRLAHDALSIAYSKLNDSVKELYHSRKEQVFSDSIRNLDNTRNITRAVMSYDFKNKQKLDSITNVQKEMQRQHEYSKRIEAQKNQRNIFLICGIAAALIAIGLWSRLTYIRKTKAVIEKEKDRSENLLLNILPAEIAEELKEKGKADARDFEMVSILFTDFKGFTAASENLSAQDLVSEINICFEAFDGFIDKYSIEKIKTIGDSYMAAGGLPVPTDDSVKNTVMAALEMQDFISKRKAEMDTAGKPAFEMRVGIHTGPVVAGIVGVKKFQYDIWGDTVNTASRMESSGDVGKVNISQATYNLVKENSEFTFISRGKIEAKGKGEMEMWFVSEQ